MVTRDFNMLPSDARAAANSIDQAVLASFRTAEKRSKPRFRDAARAAAGGNRRLSGRGNALLDVRYKIAKGRSRLFMFIDPIGPWGIRDNTDVGGPTAAHRIRSKGKKLKFRGGDGEGFVYVSGVNHPGSRRGPYWKRGRDMALKTVQTRIDPEIRKAISAAFSGSGFQARR